eukprot:TRINITY_DN3422_c0_g3_i3.p4 TRINITY_DN3422_c0_g3~~TRINITY_DN3422_c0_g3_i3.p4  ORF type:complete len:122 (-),score=14.08 TRINITY_DN3422_c0_g3_i3:123-488(-)
MKMQTGSCIMCPKCWDPICCRGTTFANPCLAECRLPYGQYKKCTKGKCEDKPPQACAYIQPVRDPCGEKCPGFECEWNRCVQKKKIWGKLVAGGIPVWKHVKTGRVYVGSCPAQIVSYEQY